MTYDAAAFEASQTLHRLADLLPVIRERLTPGHTGGNHVRTAPGSKVPINLAASQLLAVINDHCDFWCRVLMDERHDFAPASTLDERLRQVASAYGRFISDDTRTFQDDDGEWVKRTMTQDFCIEVHELMRKATALVVQPPEPKWLGVCDQCAGDMYLMPGRIAVTCSSCGNDIDLAAWRGRLWQLLSTMLATRAEIVASVRLMGGKVSYDAVKKWIQRGRLVPVVRLEDAEREMFRMHEAFELAGVEMPDLEKVPLR